MLVKKVSRELYAHLYVSLFDIHALYRFKSTLLFEIFPYSLQVTYPTCNTNQNNKVS